MSKTSENGGLINNDNQPQQQPFDVVMNEHFSKYQSKGFSRNWFIPIVKEQSLMDKLIEIKSRKQDDFGVNWSLSNKLPNTLLEVNTDDEGKLSSIYVLYSKGGKLYKVVSQKDYGVIKSRMELKNGKYVPYEKCDLEPFDGVVNDYEGSSLSKTYSYVNGKKDGECINYYKNGTKEIINYKNGKKNGFYRNTKYGTFGEYIDNKKYGEWYITPKEFIKEVNVSYIRKHLISEFFIDSVVREHFTGIYDNGKPVLVTYVNDILNGKFQLREWSGNLKLGLPNGLIKREINSDEIETINFVDGFKNGYSVKYEKDEGNRESYIISKYKDGYSEVDIKVVDSYHNIPQKFTELTQQHMNEDLFYNIVKNGMNKTLLYGELHLNDFLNDWKVSEYSTYEIKDGDNIPQLKFKKVIDKTSIGFEYLMYGITNTQSWGWKDDLTDYFINECNYPHIDEDERMIFSKDYVDEDESFDVQTFIPMMCVLNTMNDVEKVLIEGTFVELRKDNEYNPILLEYTKEVLQEISDKMKLSVDEELKEIELNKQKEEQQIQKEEQQIQKEKKENGLTLDSFPID